MINMSDMILPLLVSGIIALGLIKKVKVYECFAEGAKDGLESTFKIVIPLVGLMTAVAVFRASGALDVIAYLFAPIIKMANVPRELLPFIFLRPVSGSGSLALMNDIFNSVGPDSFAGKVVSIMMGSTETTFYVLAMYFGSVGITNYRYAIVAALLADAVGMFMSFILVNVLHI